MTRDLDSPQSCFQYWLVAHSVIEQVEMMQAREHFMDGATMLFFDEPFEQLADHSPWLIAWCDALDELPAELLTQGLCVQTDYAADDILDHFRSLLIAAFQGELIMFRAYDPTVLVPMLFMMDATRLSQILGPVKALGYWEKSQWQRIFNPHNNSSWLRQSRPWWRLIDDDLAALYRVENHAYSLSRRLWEVAPDLVMPLDNECALIESALNQAITQGFNMEQRELWAISQLATQANYSAERLVTELKLDADETLQLTNWMEK
ncbi:DUF4123 domain-containing protein [Celerinatantimonas yamalensis]|uniref:DUF4123 domain-containing protein n=1 Tax=Celerinatantimonas yamalensis TaxID=559956 RepID=A0ABW9GCP9_9GAMM